MTAWVSADMNRARVIASVHRKRVGQGLREEAVMANLDL
jgi:hypothetical protein